VHPRPPPSALSATIRPALASDEAFIVELARSAFGEYSKSALRATLAMVHDPQAQTLVAVGSDRPAGFIVLVPQSPGEAHIAAIAVAEASRGLGIGRQLLHAAENAALSRGTRKLSLATAQSNLAALDLFLGAGFRIVTRHHRYYPRGQDAVRMEKRL
jgi:ribosomal protein S18 acetylase RimI-like enzyme